MRLALFQPDIPQNLGGAIRLCACMGVALDVIRPAGFPLDDRDIARAAMDYGTLARVVLHDSWRRFQAGRRHDTPPSRIVLMTTRGADPLQDFRFHPGDTILMGRESAGVPEEVHQAADARITIPMADGARSLNVVVAAGMALWVAQRQLGG